MAKITKSLSLKTNKDTGKAEILFRFIYGNGKALRARSGLHTSPVKWNKDKGELKTATFGAEEKALKKKIDDLCNKILDAFTETDIEQITKDWLNNAIDKFHFPKKHEDKPAQISFFELFSEFLSVRKLSDVRKRNFAVIGRALQRFELHNQVELHIDTMTVETLQNLDKFLRDEHTFFTKDTNGKYICNPTYQPIFDTIPEGRIPQPRGQNTINDIFTKLRTFVLWAVDSGKTTNNPFKKFQVQECVYGTPYYITIEERNTLYATDLSHRPQLAIQRDIFVFQCLIGCRVGDLYKMTRSNIINEAIEYVPRKTKEGRPVTVQVPLNGTAKEILDRYKVDAADKLLPFISEQKYNDAIKEMFKRAGIVRNVTVRNPTTGDSEIRPINEIASSHLARRAFVGNLYKQVKDPNLVGALSGHKEGSKAFARYRDIDIDIKKALVELLENGGTK